MELDENCACVLIATKGLWNVLNYRRVADLVSEVNFLITFVSIEGCSFLLYSKMLPSNPHAIIKAPVDPAVQELIKKLTSIKQEEREQKMISITTFHTENDDTKSLESVYVDTKIIDKILNQSDGNEEFNENANETESSKDKEEAGKHTPIIKRPQTVPEEYLNRDIDVELESKANSDIYPLVKLNKNFNNISSANNARRFNHESMTIQDYTKTLLNTSSMSQTTEKTDEYIKEFFKTTADVVTQVNNYDINKEFRKTLEPIIRFKIEITEKIVERLVASALKAGSHDNITINCILLPGSGV